MSSLVRNVSSSCEVCLRNKSRVQTDKGTLGHLGPAKKPFEIMSLDTIGGLGGKRSTKKYLHLLVDHFTRFAYILTSSSQNATEFIKLITKVNEEHQIGTLLTDLFGGLCSKEFEKFLKDKNISHIVTALDSASSNGLNERLNQNLVNRIRCRKNEPNNSRAWASIAQQCTREYNSTRHSVTKFAPEYLMYGRFPEVVPSELSKHHNLLEDREQAYQNSNFYHEANKNRLKENFKTYHFQVGDRVFVENGNKLNREKLDELRLGPFRINKKISNTLFEIEIKNDKFKMYHISKLVPYAEDVL